MIGKGRPVDKSLWRQGQIPEFDFGWNTQLLIRFQQSSDLKGQEYRFFLDLECRL